jgi:hypothetical protein
MNMATLGKYCKSFPLGRFRRFPNWTEKLENARKVRQEIEGDTVEIARELTGSDYLYLQQNFTVTDSIFLDENIIFKDVTPEWIDFCTNELGVSFPSSDRDKTSEG